MFLFTDNIIFTAEMLQKFQERAVRTSKQFRQDSSLENLYTKLFLGARDVA